MNKTIVMKILEQKKINYEYFEYDAGIVDGIGVASALKEDVNQVFKTLVTTDGNNHFYVFVIPVNATLDVKKVAKIVGKKSIDMIKQKDLEPLTGYIHGGCSPIGMKKKFPTYLDKTVENFSEIFVSGGRVGLQIKIKKEHLITLVDAKIDELTLEN